MAVLSVGSGQQFTTIASAIAAANSGDTIQVQAGTYIDDFATITKDVNLVGVGGMVHMVADQNIPNGKAILVTDANVTIDHFEFSGAQVARACEMPVTTFRTMFARGHFRAVGKFRERDSNGLPHLFSLRDAVGLAVASRLMKVAPVTASRAFEIGALHFGHMSEGPEREPAKAYNFRQSGYTLLAYFPDTDAYRLIAEERDALPSLSASVHRLAVAQSPDSPGGTTITHGELLAMLPDLRAAVECMNALIVKAERIAA